MMQGARASDVPSRTRCASECYARVVLLPIERLFRKRDAREAELATLRARFSAQPSAREAGAEAVASSMRLRQLRSELSRAFDNVDACQSCGKKRPEPHGHYAGGACCGSRTLDLFTPVEVASLKLSNIRARDLVPPKGDHAGCAFRGERGCTLSSEQRPNICVRYICLELRAELLEKPEWKTISTLGAALRDEFARFETLLAE
jgi:hypothetical protein